MNTNKLTASAQYNLHLGDNLATLKNYPDNTFDSIVTDPPYFIDFLGKDWDSSKSDFTPLFKECLRVLKPGGYLLAFGAPRTFHKTVTMIEDAGFEIRDQINWIYSSGFPKAQDIGKAIQKRLGVEETRDVYDDGSKSKSLDYGMKKSSVNKQVVVTSGEAKEWEGFKTALKPASENICMARKPYKGSTIDNVLKNGLGALNIDATRVPWGEQVASAQICRSITDTVGGGILNADSTFDREYEADNAGRYPSNVIGEVTEGYQKFFYNPKVSRKERHCGFDGAESTAEALASVGGYFIDAQGNRCNKPGTDVHECYIPSIGNIKIHGAKHEVQKIRTSNPNIGNNHPTVKPVALMEYLIKLVTPPSTPTLQRKVLDPFNGSGSTGMAATKLGHHYTGCDLDPKYIAISKTRIDAWNAPEPEDNPLPDNLFGESE